MRRKNRLSALTVKNAPAGKHSDGGGLILDKRQGVGKWIFRYSFAGKRREMGLGSLSTTPLAQARKRRDTWAAMIADGRDPITERERRRDHERKALDKRDPTFKDVAEQVFEVKKAGLRGDGKRGRWFSPLAVHVIPKIGHKRITQIHQRDVRDALSAIWKTKPATAVKAIQRTRIIFKQARLMGFDVDPFTVDAAKHMLGDLNQNPRPIEATPWQGVPDLYRRLKGREASRAALRWMILTLVRSDGARGARFDEINGDVWTVPAERMKGKRGKVADFRVPLVPAALEIARDCAEFDDAYLFPSWRKGCITSTALAKTLNEMGEAGRPHGFRTSFRTWVQDTEAASYDVAETVLAHTVGNKIERSYARSDLLEPRRRLMERWAEFVTSNYSSCFTPSDTL